MGIQLYSSILQNLHGENYERHSQLHPVVIKKNALPSQPEKILSSRHDPHRHIPAPSPSFRQGAIKLSKLFKLSF